MSSFDLQPTLSGSLVHLKPLEESDFEALYRVASDPAIWEQHPAKERSEREGFRRFFEEAMDTKAAFLIIDKSTGEAMGTSRYKLCPDTDIAIEIGWTFIARKYWGGIFNREIKALMIAHAFQQFEWVLFHIADTNYRSQKAVEKIGGKRITEIDGVPLTLRSESSVIYGYQKNMRIAQG